jgi:hypothetical protein
VSRKWKPEVIIGGGEPKPQDPNPMTSDFGHAVDKFVAGWYKRHPQLDQDAALIVLMQYVAGLAVTRGCPEIDYVRCSTDLYQMEAQARNKDGA